MFPTRSSTPPTGSTPSTRRCSPTPSAWRFWWCSRRSARRSGWRSSCTTCSACRSKSANRRALPEATRQLVSRARRRVRGAPVPDADLTAQCEVVEAFLAAVRDGDFDALVAVLDPEVVLRGDAGGLTGLSRRVQGAKAVAGQALYWSQTGLTTRRALVNGAPGTVSIRDGEPFSVGAFTVKNRKIVEIDFLADLERIAQLDLTLLSD